MIELIMITVIKKELKPIEIVMNTLKQIMQQNPVKIKLEMWDDGYDFHTIVWDVRAWKLDYLWENLQ